MDTMNPDTARLLALYDGGTPEQIGKGRRWYPEAKYLCRELARDAGTTLARAAAVMAITSPDAQLVTNVRWTRDALRSKGTAKVGRYPNRMVPAVQRAMASDSPGEHVSGVKVAAFYAAIMGDPLALVLDRWALRMATGDDRPTAGNRRRAEAAYREAADLRGESPRDMQAIIWTIGRERMTRPDGATVKLMDIHDIDWEAL